MIIIFIVVVSFIYVEFVWKLVEKKKRSYESASRFLRTVTWFNYGCMLLFGSYGSLIFGAICSLYQMVIFKERVRNL